jgi:hypothetical protein
MDEGVTCRLEATARQHAASIAADLLTAKWNMTTKKGKRMDQTELQMCVWLATVTFQVYGVKCPEALKRRDFRSYRSGLAYFSAVPKSELAKEVMAIANVAMGMIVPTGRLEWSMTKVAYARLLRSSDDADDISASRIAVLESMGCSVQAVINRVPDLSPIVAKPASSPKKTSAPAPIAPKAAPKPAPKSNPITDLIPATKPKSAPTPIVPKPAPKPKAPMLIVPKPAAPKSKAPVSNVPKSRPAPVTNSKASVNKVPSTSKHVGTEKVPATKPVNVKALALPSTKGKGGHVRKTNFDEDPAPPAKRRRLATQPWLAACQQCTTGMAALGFPCDSFFREKFFEWAAEDGNEDDCRVDKVIALFETLREAKYAASAAQEEAIGVGQGLRALYNS